MHPWDRHWLILMSFCVDNNYYTTETNVQSNWFWRQMSSEKRQGNKSYWQSMATVFLGSTDCLENGRTITGKNYVTLLHWLSKEIEKSLFDIEKDPFPFSHLCSFDGQNYGMNVWTMLDLTQCDFFFFPKLLGRQVHI